MVLWVLLLIAALLASAAMVGFRLRAARARRRGANAARYSEYYARVLPLLYRYFDSQGARTRTLEQPPSGLPGQIKQLIDAHLDSHGPRTRAAFYLDDDTGYPGKRSREQAHAAQLAFLDLLLAVMDDCAHENRNSPLERVQPISALGAADRAQLDRYRCLYLAWRLLEEYGWLGSFGSIAPLGMYELRRLTQPTRRLDAKFYRLLAKQRQPPGWERDWSYQARVDPPLEWKLHRVQGRAPSMNSPFMDVCTLVITYAYHDTSEARAVVENIEKSLDTFMRQAGWRE